MAANGKVDLPAAMRKTMGVSQAGREAAEIPKKASGGRGGQKKKGQESGSCETGDESKRKRNKPA